MLGISSSSCVVYLGPRAPVRAFSGKTAATPRRMPTSFGATLHKHPMLTPNGLATAKIAMRSRAEVGLDPPGSESRTQSGAAGVPSAGLGAVLDTAPYPLLPPTTVPRA